jgi:predicted GNAT family N-acyltransferase
MTDRLTRLEVIDDLMHESNESDYRIVRLDLDQAVDQIMQLRFDILHTEFGHDQGRIRSPGYFYDRHDPEGIHLGVFSTAKQLIGALRISNATGTDSIPSARYLEQASSFTGDSSRIGEISRVVLLRSYRGKGVFRKMMDSTIHEAGRLQLSGLVISCEANQAHENFLSKLGFEKIIASYWFEDEQIAPKVRTSTFYLNLTITS